MTGRAEEELVADGGVVMLEVTVLARAVGSRVGFLCCVKNELYPLCILRNIRELTELRAILAVDVEGEVASALSVAGIGEHETVRAEFLRQLKVLALVVAVALHAVREEPVLLRAIAVLGSSY